MEQNEYLNKAIKDASKVMKIVEAQRKTLDATIPMIESELMKQGADMELLKQMKHAAKNKDLNTLKELSKKIRK